MEKTMNGAFLFEEYAKTVSRPAGQPGAEPFAAEPLTTEPLSPEPPAAVPSSARELAKEILCGGYDLHTHTEPSAFHRGLNDFELLEEADALGMAGVLIKAHYGSTAPRAALLNLSGLYKTRAYGGLALNHPTGGLNPYAVENALKMGAAIIWMPTRDSENCLKYGDMPGDFFSRPGISILDRSGGHSSDSLKAEVREIFELVKKYSGWLATGHLNAAESVLLCREGRKSGVNMILTHPEWDRTKVPGPIQQELAALGVLVEKNWLNLAEASVSPEEMAANIRLAGPEHVYLATDRGQAGAEHPAEGMLRFIETLWNQGFTQTELETMVRTVPARITAR